MANGKPRTPAFGRTNFTNEDTDETSPLGFFRTDAGRATFGIRIVAASTLVPHSVKHYGDTYCRSIEGEPTHVCILVGLLRAITRTGGRSSEHKGEPSQDGLLLARSGPLETGVFRTKPIRRLGISI